MALIIACIFGVSCQKNQFKKSDHPVKKVEPETKVQSPNETDTNPPPVKGVREEKKPEPQPEKKKEIPPDKVALILKINMLNYDSWWQNCLSVSLNNDAKQFAVGCNKNTQIGKELLLIADKPPICNRLKFRIETYKNLDNALCLKENALGRPCNGPFSNKPDWTRSPSTALESEFFRIYDAVNISSSFDKQLISSAGVKLNEIEKEAITFSKNKKNRWMKIYFEDQLSAKLAEAKKNPNYNPDDKATKETIGVDFNDYVFDVKGEDVKFTIDGSKLECN